MTIANSCYAVPSIRLLGVELSYSFCICSSKGAGSDVIGIDLGTTNSCVAVMEGKVSKIVIFKSMNFLW